MILPNKFIESNESLLGIGALLLTLLDKPITISSLWEKSRELKEVSSFDKFSLTLSFLYTINAIKINEGLLMRCSND